MPTLLLLGTVNNSDTRKCSICHARKPLSEFYKTCYYCKPCKYIRDKQYREDTKECQKQYSITYRQNHRAEKKEYDRLYHAKHKEQINKKGREHYYATNGAAWKLYHKTHAFTLQIKQRLYREINRNRIINQQKQYYKEHRAEILAKSKMRDLLTKLEVLTYYGNGKCKCVKCGFFDMRALSIDHINGGGCQHRKDKHILFSSKFYELLKKDGFPIGYQTLCMNCQFIKRFVNNESPEWIKGDYLNANTT